VSFLIRVNSFPLKRETHLALDSRLKHVAYISRFQESFVSCQNFCFFSNSPKNLFLKKFLEKGVASHGKYKNFFLLVPTSSFGGETYFAPPFNPPNPVSSWTFFDFSEFFLPYVELIPGSDFSATISKILARTLFFEKRPGSGRDVLCAQKRPG
jgi:hypothetical protein